MGIFGQDWASYQSAQPGVSGLDFAFVKIAEGLGYVNPKWRQQRDHAKANGLVWGGYYYPHMANSAKAEADYFLKQVAWQPGDVIILDWEGYDNANTGVSKARQAAYKEEWLRYVKGRMPHNPVGMYCNVDYWRNVDTTSYYADFLWIATGGRKAGDPGIKASWLFHQYTASPIDTNYCHLGSRAALRSWALSFAAPQNPPTSEEDDMPTPAELWAFPLDTPDGRHVPAGGMLAWSDRRHDVIYTEITNVKAQLAGLTATVQTLAGLIGQEDDVDTDAVVAAVQQAIAAAVVHVDVNVTGTN